MLRVLRFVFLAFSSLALAPVAVAGDSPVVLTIAGEISEANRGPVDPSKDRFFVAQGIEFEAAFSIDLATLQELEQSAATVRGYNWPAARTLVGPRLDDVLGLVGADPSAILTLHALDGYIVELTPEDRAGAEWSVATHEGETPLAIGGWVRCGSCRIWVLNQLKRAQDRNGHGASI